MKEDCQTKTYVGLDVSVADTHICVLNEEGTMLFEGAVTSEPDVIAETIFKHASNCDRVAVETGATTPWLWRELKQRGIPVICIDARHANKALSMRMNKTDRNDARGLAELMRIGWFKEANVRTLEAQEIRSMLSARYQLRLNPRDIMNQMRGIVKTFGLFTGSTATRKFPEMVREIIHDVPSSASMLAPLLAAHDALLDQIKIYEEQLKDIAKNDVNARRIMTVPGVSYLVALGFMTAIDDPTRFSSSNNVGPYLGLAPECDNQEKPIGALESVIRHAQLCDLIFTRPRQ